MKDRKEFEEALAKSIEGMKEELKKSDKWSVSHGDPHDYHFKGKMSDHDGVYNVHQGKEHKATISISHTHGDSGGGWHGDENDQSGMERAHTMAEAHHKASGKKLP